jgi:hypothetical protein
MKFLFIGMLIGFCISLLSVFLTLMFSPSQKIDGLYDVEISNNNRWVGTQIKLKKKRKNG